MTFLASWLLVTALLATCTAEHGDFVNQFVIHVNGGDVEADELTHHITKRGAVLQDKLYSESHGTTLHFRHNDIRTRSKRSADEHSFVKEMEGHELVSRIEQQREIVRVKRGYKTKEEVEIAKRTILDKQRELEEPLYYEDKRVFKRVDLTKQDNANIVEKEYIPGEERYIELNDPHWHDQWYLLNNGQAGGAKGLDINVVPVWQQGYSGKGVTVCILDDGIEHSHDDLRDNYSPEASADFNADDDDPTPNPDNLIENSHGTRCAGEVAAKANNSVCGVGVAFNSNIGGVRILDGPVTDSLEYRALVFKNQVIDIYSASWGPPDSGKVMEAPGKYCEAGLRDGINQGRGGKGSIFVWASGNGGYRGDDCGCDGYVSSPYTLSIGSINNYAESTYFMEWCPSTMAVIFTGGYHTRESALSNDALTHPMLKIVTTDTSNKCTLNFQGTSAAAPLAAGVMALVLEANPNLTWRDVQHLVVLTSKIPNTFEKGWTINGAGLHINDRFGYGVLDAGQLVEQAQKWSTVGPWHNCTVESYADLNLPFSPMQNLTTNLETEGCQKIPDNRVNKLEHVQLHINLSHPRRGDIRLVLISPAGTRSEMLSPRKNDDDTNGINFTFMTVRCWNENPSGAWVLVIQDTGMTGGGVLHSWSLSLLGTSKTDKTRAADVEREAFEPDLNDLNTLMDQEKKAAEYVDIKLGDPQEAHDFSSPQGTNQKNQKEVNKVTDKVGQLLEVMTPEDKQNLVQMLQTRLAEAKRLERKAAVEQQEEMDAIAMANAMEEMREAQLYRKKKQEKKELYDKVIDYLEDIEKRGGL